MIAGGRGAQMHAQIVARRSGRERAEDEGKNGHDQRYDCQTACKDGHGSLPKANDGRIKAGA